MDAQGQFKLPTTQTGSVEMNEGKGNVQDPGSCRRLRKPRKLRSAVWNHMTRQHLGDGNYVVFCNHCKRKMGSMGTTNLKSHLRFCAVFKHSKNTQADAEMSDGQIIIQGQVSCAGLPKRRNRSAVWNDMTKEQIGDGNYLATCNHCKKKMVGSSAKGTTHLRNHLRFCAAFRHSKGNQADAGQLLLEPTERNKKWTNTLDFFRFDPERSRQDFARMLILHEYPFSIIDHVGFRKFLKNLQPQFKLISQSTIQADCVKVYESEREKLLEALDKICSRVSLTANMSTTIGNVQYLCLTCHFIDGDWKLQERILNFINVRLLHDNDELVKVIKDKIFGWHINGKLFTFVLGDSLRYDAALKELLGHSCFWSELVFDGDFLHMRCFAHLLDVIVSEGLKVKEVSSIIEGIRRNVKHIVKSQERKQCFQRCVQQLGVPEKSLVLDCPTRWDSTYSMLETALEFKNVFSHLLGSDGSYNLLPASTDWESVQAVVDCLSLFHEVTSRFHNTRYPTINFCFVDLCFLHMKLKELCDSSSQCIKPMALKMYEKLENYWGEANMLPAIGSILDPRFKMKSIDYVFGQVYCDDLFEGYKRVDDVRQAFIKLYETYSAQYEHIVTSLTSPVSNGKDKTCLEDECGKNVQANKNTLESMRKGLGRLLRETSKVQTQKADIDLYLEEGVITTDDDGFNILNWWMQHAERYPVLSMMAHDVLAVPVSSFVSKSNLRSSWMPMDQYQGHLDAKTIEGLLCAQHWLRSEMKASLHDESEDSLSTIFTGIDLIKAINEESEPEGNLSHPSSS